MQWQRNSNLIEQLLQAPESFHFFQAIRLLELWRSAVRPGESPETYARKYWRFVNSTNLAFPPSELAQATAYDASFTPIKSDELSESLAADTVEYIEIMPTFMGLLGSQGALPWHYSESLNIRVSEQPIAGSRAFFDLFSNRAVYLFYSAWKKYRPAIGYESLSGDHFLSQLMALAGLGHPALRNKLCRDEGSVYDSALAHYTTAIRQRPPSARYIENVIKEYFSVPIKIEQFIGQWYDVPDCYCSQLGTGNNANLGKSAHLGSRVWQRDLRLRLCIGPLDREQFENFLPVGERAAALKKLLLLMAGLVYEYEIVLICKKEGVKGSTLNETEGTRLGWDTFLSTRPETSDRGDAKFVFH